MAPYLRIIAAIAMLIKDAGNLTMGQPLIILANSAVELLIRQPPDCWLSNTQMTHYQSLLLDADRVQFGPAVTINPCLLLRGKPHMTVNKSLRKCTEPDPT